MEEEEENRKATGEVGPSRLMSLSWFLVRRVTHKKRDSMGAGERRR